MVLEGIGLDVGSTTAKVVAARAGRIVHRSYRRHRGECLACAESMLGEATAVVGADAPRFVTGSAGSRLSVPLAATYVHEIHALALAVRTVAPDVRTVIELGGQDAKMIHLGADSFSSEMNERCAAGTGATLDRCLYRLGVDADALTHVAIPDDAELPLVSAKCGVFAETDLVHLTKSGVSLPLVLAALLDAVVRGNLAVLARGRPLAPKVLLLGGPHAHFPGLTAVWRRHLTARWRELGIPHGVGDEVRAPPLAEYFAAEGALRSADELARLAAARGGSGSASRRVSLVTTTSGARVMPALQTSVAGRDDHVRVVPPRAAASRSGGLALGLDAGSTTVKAVVIDDCDVPVARAYRRAEHGPLEDARAILSQLARELGPDADRITSFGVTGYAAGIIGPVFGADADPVETLAHVRSALRYVPRVDVVCDVGGQDIKVLCLSGGEITRFHLSSQCAAGNGALLEATAHDMGVPMDGYADLARTAARVPELALGCAVFLHTERVSLQAQGFTPAEILAGMASVLPRNIWEVVVGEPSLLGLGRVFVLSGGVQRNAAAVEAQANYLRARHPGVELLVHPYPGEAGAIGAAIVGREAPASCDARATRFVGLARAAGLAFSTRSDSSTRCGRCPSACPRTVVDAMSLDREPVRSVTGHACERGETLDGSPERPPSFEAGVRGARDLLRFEAARLFTRGSAVPVVSRAGRGLRVAIPRVLSMYRSAPFFLRYLQAIGVAGDDLLLGEETDEELWRLGAGHGIVDACFPVKVAQAHVAALLAGRAERPFDVLFFPVLTHAVTAIHGGADTASCPVVAATPLVTRAAFGFDAQHRLPGGPRLLCPTLKLTDPPRFAAQLFEAIREVAPALTTSEHAEAVRLGRDGQRAFERSMERHGAEALARARADGHAAFVMLSRPYHADPGLHHEIGSELRALGRTTLSIRALPKDPQTLHELGASGALEPLAGLAAALTNSGDGEKLFGARVVAAHPQLCAIEVSSFKCGQDAALYGRVEAIARRGGKPFLALHDLDETRPTGSLRLRLRTFLDAVQRYEARTRAAAHELRRAVP